MPTFTLTKTPRTLIAESTNNGANATTRGGVELLTKQGGVFTGKITNGATSPGAQAVLTLLIAHNSGTLPAMGGEGSVWKTLAVLGGGGIVANAVTPFSYEIPFGVMHLAAEFTGNTGQPILCEAFLSEVTNGQSV